VSVKTVAINFKPKDGARNIDVSPAIGCWFDQPSISG
jgi:hypothetical protein